MSEFQPFRGVRFDEERVGDLSRVVSPPYDVISPEEQTGFYDLHPNNAVRLDFPKVQPNDNEEENRYTRAGACFRKWLEEGVLTRDPQPSYYLIEDHFADEKGTDRVRYGIMGLKRLESYRPGASIKPHETTFDAPKQDRFQLMKASESNFSPIFAVYEDPSYKLEEIFKQGPLDGKYSEAMGRDNVKRRWFALSDPEQIRSIERFLGEKPLLIADGHHRYETCLTYRDWRRSQDGSKPGTMPYDSTLMYITNTESPGLCVYPAHRILKQFQGLDIGKFLSEVGEIFSVIRVGTSSEANVRERFLSDLRNVPEGGMKIGCRFRDPDLYCVLSAPDVSTLAHLFPEETPSLVKELDVSVLHEVVLGRLLGLSREQQSRQEYLAYAKGEALALEMLDGEKQDLCAAFLLNPAPVSQIMKIAFEGILLPQKTTYFFPKVMTGLVFRDMRA